MSHREHRGHGETHRRWFRAFVLFSVFSVFSVAPLAFAVGTSHWTHTSETDFKNGTFDNVVATNLGDLKLSRGVKKILEQDARVSSVYALVQAKDGTVYAGTGPQGVVLAIKDDKVADAAKLEEGTSVFSLALDKDGRLLIGTGGEAGKILRLTKPGEKPEEVFTAEGVQYVWAIYPTPDGKQEAILDSNENNLLSLTGDGKELLYAGSDPHGLVYRVNRKTKESFVVHDAAESEISALVLAADGTLYAGTGETVEQGESETPATTEEAGRPEGGTGGVEIPSTPPKDPAPPPAPDPNPGEPDPIPKKALHRGIGVSPMLLGAAHGRDTHATVILAADKQQENPGDDSPLPVPGTGPSEPATPTPIADPTAPPSGEAGEPREGGNAIYRITPDGFVTTVFRQPVLVLSIIEDNGTLLVGTGSEGNIYQVKPAADETIVLAKVDPKQVMCLLPARDGRILMGLANTGGISAMTSGFAATGTYTSSVLDASQISQFGKMQLHGSLPKGSALKVATRSGNLAEPDETGWSKWSEDVPAAAFLPIKSPSARFLQYRLTFTSESGEASAIVDDVDVAYQVPNLAPEVKSVKLAASAEGDAAAAVAAMAQAAGATPPAPQGTGKQTITWESSDPNSDAMVYSAYFRNGSRAPWILLKDKLKEPTFEWDTRGVADGRYEVRVVASDAAANPTGTGKTAQRVSDPIIVDNSAPALSTIKAEPKGAGAVISFTAVDRTSTLAKFEYAVDSSEDWQAVLPSDSISDGPEESVTFTVSGLSGGPHQVAVRATDARGNRTTQTTLVTVEATTAGAAKP